MSKLWRALYNPVIEPSKSAIAALWSPTVYPDTADGRLSGLDFDAPDAGADFDAPEPRAAISINFSAAAIYIIYSEN
jgi:hypothetical protein